MAYLRRPLLLRTAPRQRSSMPQAVPARDGASRMAVNVASNRYRERDRIAEDAHGRPATAAAPPATLAWRSPTHPRITPYLIATDRHVVLTRKGEAHEVRE